MGYENGTEQLRTATTSCRPLFAFWLKFNKTEAAAVVGTKSRRYFRNPIERHKYPITLIRLLIIRRPGRKETFK